MAKGKPYNEYHGKPGKRSREVFRGPRSGTIRLEQRYRALYWDKCELQLILTDCPTGSQSEIAVTREMNERERIMTAIVTNLGYTPNV